MDPILLDALGRPDAYPFPADTVEVCHTHISAVFLVGPHVYKVKKPRDLGFLDFTTLEKRHYYCEEEVRLNRRMAPEVYRGVVPITRTGGRVRVGGDGDPVEWAVWMRRLPEEATLRSRLDRGELGAAEVRAFARRLARFHAEAEGGPKVAPYGRFEVVARNARENLEQAAVQVGHTLSPEVHRRLDNQLETGLDRLRPLIDARAEAGVPRDTHGDLHLDHVYHFPHRPAPGDWVAVDCIEFDERFRFADPVADAAFLSMDLTACGRRDLATAFAETYFDAGNDRKGHRLLAFYEAYRAAVRAKVDGMAASSPEVPDDRRRSCRVSARAHWLLALGLLAPPGERPCLVATAGLPGSGKSRLSRALAERFGTEAISTDKVRKTLAGLPPTESARAPVGQGIYTTGWTERTYTEVLERAGKELFRGRTAVVDGTFATVRHRRALAATARAWGVPAVLVVCSVEPATALARIAGRTGNPSDADARVFEAAAQKWEPVAPGPDLTVHHQDTGGTRLATEQGAVGFLRQEGLLP